MTNPRQSIDTAYLDQNLSQKKLEGSHSIGEFSLEDGRRSIKKGSSRSPNALPTIK